MFISGNGSPMEQFCPSGNNRQCPKALWITATGRVCACTCACVCTTNKQVENRGVSKHPTTPRTAPAPSYCPKRQEC